MSGVGKGIATSSIALILSEKGYRVNNVKVDPYLNVDAGTMNPTEHGEVFVLESGLETDQDMGNYERFLNRSLASEDYMTSGMVYQHIIDKERNLGYAGKCVEAIPHVRDEIVRRYRAAADANRSDITRRRDRRHGRGLQNALFIEAVRALKTEQPNDVIIALVSYLPVPGTLGEMKTRPRSTPSSSYTHTRPGRPHHCARAGRTRSAPQGKDRGGVRPHAREDHLGAGCRVHLRCTREF